ncbi:hypothetical protein HK096_010859 [Nowakowskiella sp. JEL0078]|nr:hypothetical protein HK096_010859 [Nowakowskiella sp. JEL0078]
MDISQASVNQLRSQPAVSLFQQCMSMVEKLYRIPYFEQYLFPGGVNRIGHQPDGSYISFDPVQLLWDCFRLGAPLAHLFNQLHPQTPLEIPDISWFSAGPDSIYKSTMKKPVMQFLVACKSELSLTEAEGSVIVSDLYKEDTNCFVKILKIVERLIEKIEDYGYLPPPRALPFSVPNQQDSVPTDNRSKLLAELLDTERNYLQDLERLHTYQKVLLDQNILTKEKGYQIFANLDSILDFQRRFLIQMEACLSLPPNEQRLGYLFLSMEEQFCSYYEPYCGNYENAVKKAAEERNSLMRLSSLMDPLIALPSHLIKPIQRICKYPLFIADLIKMNGKSGLQTDELQQGLEAVKRMADTVNEQKRREENFIHKAELIERMEEWKGLNPDDFGELLLLDKFPMSSGEIERDYHIYLFSKLLLCCKDLGRRTKNRQSRKDKTSELTTYALRGNISINLILDVRDTSNEDQTNCAICITWKDNGDKELFTLKCKNHEQVRLWKKKLERIMYEDKVNRKKDADAQFNIMYQNVTWGPDDEYSDSRSSSTYASSKPLSRTQSRSDKSGTPRSSAFPFIPPAAAALSSQGLNRASSSPTIAKYDRERGRQSERQGGGPRGSSAGSALRENNSDYYNPYNRSSSSSPPPNGRSSQTNDPYGLPPGVPPTGPLPAPPINQVPSNVYSHETYFDPNGYPPSPSTPLAQIGQGRRPPPLNNFQRYDSFGNGNGNTHRSPTSQSFNNNWSESGTNLQRSFSYTVNDPQSISQSQRVQVYRKQSVPQIVDVKTVQPTTSQITSISRRSITSNSPFTPPNMPLPPNPTGISNNYPSQMMLPSPNQSEATLEYKSNRRRPSSSSLHSSHSAEHYANRSSTPPPPVPALPSNYAFPATQPPVSSLMQQLSGSQGTPSLSAKELLEGLESSLLEYAEDPDGAATSTPPIQSPVNFYQQSGYFPHNSNSSSSTVGSSTGSTAINTHNRKSSSQSTHSKRSTSRSASQTFIKVRTHYGRETLVVAVQMGCSFNELYTRIDEKIRMYGGNAFLTEDGAPKRLRFKYQDDAGDHIRIDNDSDVMIAFDMAKSSSVEKCVLNLYVS